MRHELRGKWRSEGEDREKGCLLQFVGADDRPRVIRI